MVFTSGTRERGAELAITECAAKRGDSANDPKHEQRESRLNIGQLKSKTGEDACANDVGDNDGRCRDEPDSSPRRSRLHGTRFSNRSHLQIDNPEIIRSSEFFRSGIRVHNWRASWCDTLVAVGKFAGASDESRITSSDFPELSEAIPGITLKVA